MYRRCVLLLHLFKQPGPLSIQPFTLIFYQLSRVKWKLSPRRFPASERRWASDSRRRWRTRWRPSRMKGTGRVVAVGLGTILIFFVVLSSGRHRQLHLWNPLPSTRWIWSQYCSQTKRKKSRRSRDLNPGLLGGKKKWFLCATQPLRNYFYLTVVLSSSLTVNLFYDKFKLLQKWTSKNHCEANLAKALTIWSHTFRLISAGLFKFNRGTIFPYQVKL